MRGPFKRQALRVLANRGITIGTVIDVGVLTGTPELIDQYPDALHLLFEPVAEFNSAIAKTYRSVRHEIVNSAVSDRSGETLLEQIDVVDVAGFDHSHSNVTSAPVAGRPSRTVPMTTLDDFLKGRELPGPWLLKIDIDGHELAAIAGATETLKKCAVVIVEVTIAELPQRIAAVAAQGFALFDLVEPCYYDNALWQCDAVFLRSDLHAERYAELGVDFDAAKYSMFKPPFAQRPPRARTRA